MVGKMLYLNIFEANKVFELYTMNPAQHTLDELEDVRQMESEVQDRWVSDDKQKEHRRPYLEELHFLYELEAKIKFGIAIMESEDWDDED